MKGKADCLELVQFVLHIFSTFLIAICPRKLFCYVDKDERVNHMAEL